jgi:hypothetical protein
VGGVSGDVATFVVSVNGQVQTHQLNEVLVSGETELVGQVVAVILSGVGWRNLAILVHIAVNAGSDVGKLSNEVHGVLKGVLPVFCLLHALCVCLGEGGFTLESSDGDGELSHWVEVIWATVDELLDKFGELRAGGPFCRKIANLLFRWNFASQQKPEETFWKWLRSTWCLRKLFLAFWDLTESAIDQL